MRVRVRVPASTANLGSGFDALGMALALYDTVEAELTGDGVRIMVEGEGAGEVPADERHLVAKAAITALTAAGVTPDGLELRCQNAIPHSRGLGSSAAAVVAGVAVAYALLGKELDDDALQLAAEFEGHADNAAASLLGGLVIAWKDGDRYRASRLQPHPDVAPVVLIPQVRSSTKTTRGLLPDRVAHADAAFAAGRSALAVHAMTTRPDLLLPATEDRLHQSYRRPAWPETADLVDTLRALGVPAVVSGAGPTVLALPEGGRLPEGLDLAGFTAHRLDVDQHGVRIETP